MTPKHEYDPSKHWYGVDLDGTLAKHVGWKGVAHVGEAIPEMLERVKRWISEGKTVKIFTARVALPDYNEEGGEAAIRDWFFRNGLPLNMEITNVKDTYMLELWDDRCIQVIFNTGKPVRPSVSKELDDIEQEIKEIAHYGAIEPSVVRIMNTVKRLLNVVRTLS